MASGNYFEISCNRFDGYISLSYKNATQGAHKSTINSLKFLTDDEELSSVLRWLNSIPTNSGIHKTEEIKNVPIFV